MSAVSRLSAGEMVKEANRLLDRASGTIAKELDALRNALAGLSAVDLGSLAVSDPQLEPLANSLTDALAAEQLLARRSGSRKTIYLCVAISILFMYVVAHLTYIYNNGAALLAETEALAVTQPDRRFGQLERQLLTAKLQLFDKSGVALISDACRAKPADCSDQDRSAMSADELSRESPYILLHELRDLDTRVQSIRFRIGSFRDRVRDPIPLVSWLDARLTALWAWILNENAKDGPAEAESGGPPQGKTQVGREQNYQEGQLATLACAPDDKTKLVVNANPSEVRRLVLGMDMGAVSRQACSFNLVYTSITLPSVSEWVTELRTTLSGFPFWLLPALYAALGSMIFYMRLILDPAQPNPPFHRIFHRLALAALAGIIISWLWEPTFSRNEDFTAFGIGLFTFAFVMGFSIEVFFSLLDRLVKLADGAVAKLGT